MSDSHIMKLWLILFCLHFLLNCNCNIVSHSHTLVNHGSEYYVTGRVVNGTESSIKKLLVTLLSTNHTENSKRFQTRIHS